MSSRVLSVSLRNEHDVVLVRQRARTIAAFLGFERQDQTRIATAVSEIARNAVQYAGGGRVEFAVQREPGHEFSIRVEDEGPGIRHLDDVLEGRYQSPTGMGIGMVGARRLMDRFQVQLPPGGGTTVCMARQLPRVVTAAELSRLAEQLVLDATDEPAREVQRQNQELLAALEELELRAGDVDRLSRELDDTNRGVLALYAELDEKAEALRRASELKSRFLSNISHEFRTPLNSILSLSRLLLERLDGELTEEQERQVVFIRRSAEGLSELVNDLLDLAKIEAGKVAVRPGVVRVPELFAALRGMFRPLVQSDSVTLLFDDAAGVPELWTDESKLSQILRNFISNALKFTERGSVRVSVEEAGAMGEQKGSLLFSVADTGIGIAPEDQQRIFEEFTQVEGPHQRNLKGTGLGLSLSRRLAELLGGTLSLESRPGAGATFRLLLPLRCAGAEGVLPPAAASGDVTPPPLVILMGAHAETIGPFAQAFRASGQRVSPVRSVDEARQALRHDAAGALVLIGVPAAAQALLLRAVRRDERTRSLPVVVVGQPADRGLALAEGADLFTTEPVDPEDLYEAVHPLLGRAGPPRVLLIDDDEVFRYVVRGHLQGCGYAVSEAETGAAGLRGVRDSPPDLILLDLVMPALSGYEVLADLKADPRTRGIPVLIVTSKPLEPAEREHLGRQAVGVLSKQDLSREKTRAAVAGALRESGA